MKKPNKVEQLSINGISLDFINSDDAIEIDRGIRESIKGIKYSIIAIAISLARVKTEKIFLKLGFKKNSEYLGALIVECDVSRSSIYNWLYIGETYFKYKNELEEIGFDKEKSHAKLPYLKRALAVGDKNEVFNNLMNMNIEEFSNYARARNNRQSGDFPFWEDQGYIYMHKGKKAIIINKDLGDKTTNMLKAALNAAFKALERNGKIVAVHLDNAREVRLFKPAARRIRDRIREKKR